MAERTEQMSAHGSGTHERRVAQAVWLRPFDGEEGVEATAEALKIHRRGELVESVDGPGVEAEAGWLDPHAGVDAPGFGWAVAVARHFPDDVFCFGQPVSFELSVRLGTDALEEDLEEAGTTVRAFYDATLFESFDGQITFENITGGSSESEESASGAHQGSFWEWRRDVSNLAEYPPHKRRVVDISLPTELSGHEEDLVLLHRISEAVCELIRRYAESGGKEVLYRVGSVDNLFAGGDGGALPRRVAPVLYGRSVNDVYRRAEPERLMRG